MGGLRLPLRRRRQKIHFVALSFHFIGLVAVLQGPLEKSIVVPSVIVTGYYRPRARRMKKWKTWRDIKWWKEMKFC